MPAKSTIPLAERFWARVDCSGACWPWTGSLTRDGYGHFAPGGPYGRRLVLAHRFGWELTHGPIPPELRVLHTCDNPPCVNPAHLWLGTQRDNMRDAAAKGRVGAQQHPDLYRTLCRGRSVLTAAQVLEIRALADTEGLRVCVLARRYGVRWTVIKAVISRETWQHI